MPHYIKSCVIIHMRLYITIATIHTNHLTVHTHKNLRGMLMSMFVFVCNKFYVLSRLSDGVLWLTVIEHFCLV